MVSTTTLPTPFNTAQLEILQLFAEGIDEKELALLRQILIDFKFNQVTTLVVRNGNQTQHVAQTALPQDYPSS